jgi:hypothetical protein
MKNIFKTVLFLVIFSCAFWACKKDEAKDYYNGGTNPVLTASTDSIRLSYANASQTAVTFSWTNPNYQFTTGVSSQNVAYKIEIDTAGSNFTNPNRQTISVSKDLSLTLTTSTFNDYLLNQLQLQPGVSHKLEVRVSANLVNNSAVVPSNVLKYAVTPYAIPPKVAPPSSATLFIVGSATPGGGSHGWDNPISQNVSVQQFTQVSTTLYTITLPLIGGGEYKFIAVNGSWNDQWSIAVNDDPNEVNGGDFVFNGQNILAPAASGNYKIDLDFQRGKFTVTKQ